MHARELVELAALVSAHGAALIRTAGPIPSDGLEQYWSASQARLDRWARALKNPTDAGHTCDRNQTPSPQAAGPADPSEHLRPVLEEILTGEVLTRVWCGVLAAYDRSRGTQDVEPVARSVLVGQMEARHRALELLVHGPGVSWHDALALDRLRRRSERWTDLLVGHLLDVHDVSRFAANPDLAREFAADLRDQGGVAPGSPGWFVLLASLRAAFRVGLGARSPNADLNTRIAGGILACFAGELFDSTGLLQSLWMARLAQVALDTQGMIADLFAAERGFPAPPAGGIAPLPGPDRGQRRFGH